MSGFFIEPLDTRHNRKDFDCGEPELNAYLQCLLATLRAPERA